MYADQAALAPPRVTARRPFAVALLSLVVVAGGCANYLRPMEVERARPAAPTAATHLLRDLPPPAEPVVVAVYRFRDQTGQYRALENVSTFSTAVTQGATSILVEALEESGWFVPIEREGLPNLLNERQIIQSVRAQHTGPDGEALGPLPPLLYAGVILEGGIIGYDTNLLTGGVGARYLGIGGSGQYRQDQVTISLRAVSVQSGRVLKTVRVTKTVLSQRLDSGVFRYVALRRLLEVEAGYSFNEPPVVAVTEAIEEAVRALIIEGVREEVWALRNPGDATSAAFRAYDADVAASEQTDAFGREVIGNRPGVGIGVLAGGALYEGDYQNALARPTGELVFRIPATPHFSVGASISGAELAAQDAFTQRHVAADLHGLYYVLPRRRATPYLLAGAGALLQLDPLEGAGDGLFPYLKAGVGLEYMATPRLGLDLAVENTYPLEEGLDGLRNGAINDNYWTLKLGLLFYMR